MAQIINSRNKLLNEAATRILGANVYITSGTSSSLTVPANSNFTVPGTIILTAVPSRYVAPQYSWSYRFGDSGSFISINNSNTNTITVNGDSTFVSAASGFNVVQYKVDVVETATQGANPSNFILTIPILRQGVNSVLGVLSNESQAVYAYADGSVPAGTVVQSTLYIYNGTLDDSANWAASISTSPGITATLVNGKTISVSLPINTLNGFVDITATRQGYPTIVKRFTVNKVLSGTVGKDGNSTALVYAYKRAAVAPVDNPGAVDYSFTTNTITTASLLNGWQKTIPSGTDPLYVTVATASSSTTTDSIAAGEWASPVLLVQNGTNGTNGVNGLNTATVFLYARNNSTTTAPTLATTGTATYTFSTGALSGTIPSGWSTSIPDVASGSVIWVSQATASSSTATDSINNTEWSAPRVLAQKGENGSTGNSTALVYAYKRAAVAPVDNPGAVDYSFTTNTITTASLLNGWQKTIPSGSDPLYVTVATASSSTTTDSIAAGEWASPVLLVQNGTNGLNTATVFLYARNNSTTTAPTLATTGTATYTFSTGALSGTIPSGWSTSIPDVASGSVIWVSQATASSSTATDSINNTEWSAPKVLAQKGELGNSTALVYAYKRSSSIPTDSPGQVSYSFSTNTITTTTLLNGWQKTIPVGADPLYVRVATASSNTNTDDIQDTEWSAPVLLVQNGTNGINGLNTATVFLYARNNSTTTAPTLATTGTATYTFSTGALSGTIPSGWSTSIPDVASGSVIWVSQATASSSTATDSINNTEWSAPKVLAQKGENGSTGNSTALVYAYKRAAVAPVDNPGAVDYSFTTNTITTASLLNGWQKTIPSGTDPLYVTAATASSSTTTDSIAAGEWASPVLLVQNGTNGVNGLNTATVFLYARNNSTTTAPTFATTGTATYTFSTGALSGTIPSGWSTTIPDVASGSVIWVSQATASSSTATDSINNTEWSAPKVLAQKGDSGVSPTSYEVSAVSPVINRSASNTLTPSTLVVNAYSTVGDTKSAYSGRFKIYEDDVLRYTSSTNQSTYTYTPVSPNTVGLFKVELYQSGGTITLLDTQEIPVTVSGSSGITISISNTAFTAPADNSGAVSTYVGSGTTIQVFEGSTALTYRTTLGTNISSFTIGTPTLSVANAITVGARSGDGTTTATVANHSAMSNSVSAVVISYPITYNRANGAQATQIVTQTITKALAGSIGVRGSRQIYDTNASYTSTYDFDGGGTTLPGADSYAARATQLVATVTAGLNPTTPINGDTVTFTNGTNYVYTITHNGTAWIPPGTIIDGNLLVTGSVTASKINSNGLSIRDSIGNVILSAGSSLQDQAGNGTNLSANASLQSSNQTWEIYTNTSAGRSGTLSYAKNQNGAPTGYGSVVGSWTGPVSADYDDSLHQNYGYIPCTPGERLEVQCKVQVFRGNARLELGFLNSNNNFIPGVPDIGVVQAFGDTNWNTNLSDFVHLWGFITVPAGAVKAKLEIRVRRTSTSANTDLYVTQPYIGRAKVGQTAPTVWNDSTPFITGSNASTYIANAAIGAAQIGSISLVGTNNFNVKTKDSTAPDWSSNKARMEMDSRVIKIFDASGVLRIQLGDLTI